MKSALASLTTAAAIGLGLLTLGSLGGCSSTTTMTYLPSGDTGFAINCSGSDASSSWAECYKRAGEVCGNYGYDVVSKDVDNGATRAARSAEFSVRTSRTGRWWFAASSEGKGGHAITQAQRRSSWRRRLRPERGSMRAAKANSTPSAIGQTPRKMINQVMTSEGKK